MNRTPSRADRNIRVLRQLFDVGQAELTRSRHTDAGILDARSRIGRIADQLYPAIATVLARSCTLPAEEGPAVATLLVRSARLHQALSASLAETDSALYQSLSLVAREFKRTPRFADGVTFACGQLSEVTAGPVLFSTVGDDDWRIVATADTAASVPDQGIPLAPGSAEYRAVELGQLVSETTTPTAIVRRLLGAAAYVVVPVSTPEAAAGLIHCVVADPVADTAYAYLSLLASIVGTAWATDVDKRALHAVTRLVHDEFCSSTDICDGEITAAPISVRLTRREDEVLQLVLRGRSNPEIAAILFVSVETVKSHLKSLLRKYGAANRSELIALVPAASTETRPQQRSVR
ncbi:response regulator transcription factor [Nocardia vaccinii]|uniref:response regulator transcription factor n=1 Tax=Nocardia vaccinii TaxID=1822 RepID=UPI00082D5BFF|nr:helix-turn-helix transcriptional regulator [Nocardia vaccinii]